MSGIIQSKFHVFKGLLFPEVLTDVNFARIRGGIREIGKN